MPAPLAVFSFRVHLPGPSGGRIVEPGEAVPLDVAERSGLPFVAAPAADPPPAAGAPSAPARSRPRSRKQG